MGGGRHGSKRVQDRLGLTLPAGSGVASSSAGKVCIHWRAGLCNRFPCRYIHSELPEAPPKRPNHSPNTGGGGSNSKAGKGPVGGERSSARDKLCKFFVSGDCSYGDKCRFLHGDSINDSFSLVTTLRGHQGVVTGIALPSGTEMLFSGSKDGSVHVWDYITGQCAGAINIGREVGCMISHGPWMFVGIPDAVKGWNTQTGTEMSLSGPTGQVYALAIGNGMLFAAAQDGRILAWRFSTEKSCSELAASLVGHQGPIVSLVVGAMRLYSGSMDNTIRVWDLATLQWTQTLSDHTRVVMSLLCWDQFLLSCSLDQTIKAWAATEGGSLEVAYTHKEDQGALALSGMQDAQLKPVLLCSTNDSTVHLYDLPPFSKRGKIFSKEKIRAMQIGPGGLFFTGDGTGELKVWKCTTE